MILWTLTSTLGGALTGGLFNYLMISLISFLIGVLVGWSISTELGEIEETTVRRIIAIVLLSVYIVSVLSEIWIVRYETPMLLHSVVGGVIGYLISKGEGSIIDVSAIRQGNDK